MPIHWSRINFSLSNDLFSPCNSSVYYDESFAYLSEGSAWSLDKTPPISTAFSPVYGDNGDVVQFTIPTSVPAATWYVRLAVDDINEDSIITVNEEIPD